MRFQKLHCNFQIERGALATLLGVMLVILTLGVLQANSLHAAPAAEPSAAPLDVVINEVAWGGTGAASTDEWIELYNNTAAAIDLTGWTLVAGDGSPTIALSGVISAHGYFLLERTDDNTVSDIPANQIYTGDLNNAGETLTLRDGASNVIDTANGNGGGWPAGSGSPTYYSMERANPLTADIDANWASNKPLVKRNGLDANSNPINGTPKSRNSATAPDLRLTKTGPASVLAGREMTYTLSFGNAGIIGAPDARITDTLPPSVTFVRDTIAFTFSQPVSGTLVWLMGALPEGAQGSFEVVVSVETGAWGNLTNLAVITSSEAETQTSNNIAEWSTLVALPLADLSIAKTGPVSVTVGNAITYAITFSNAGLLNAAGVVITDVLPAAVSFTQQSSMYPFTRTGNTLVWQVGDVLTTAAPVAFAVAGQVDENAFGVLTNQAQIASASPEAQTANNQDSVTTTLVRAIHPLDVVVNEIAWSGTQADASHEWIELKNNTSFILSLSSWHLTAADGTPSIALNGQIPPKGYFLLARTNYTNVVDVPADMVYSGALEDTSEVLTLTDDEGQVIDTANGNDGAWPAGTTGTGTPPRASMERIDPSSPDTDTNWTSNDGIVRNGHDISGNPINGTPKQANSASRADLGLVKLAPLSVLTGDLLTYTLVYSNSGPLNAAGVVVTDTLPPNVTFITQTSPYAFTQVGQVLTWQIGALPVASGTQSLSLAVQADAGFTGWLANTASITSATPDYALANNVFTATTQVVPPSADLSIAKSAPASIVAGNEITYTLVLSNVGQATATGARVTDTLPISVTFMRHTAPYSLTLDGRALVWQVGNVLTSGAPLSWTVTGLVELAFVGISVNEVKASTTTQEPVTANNTAQATTFVLSPQPAVLINGVMYDGYQLDDVDESLQIINVGQTPATLQDWRLARGASSGVSFPAFTLDVNQRAWATKNAVAFRSSFGFTPTFAVAGLLPGVLQLGGSWPALSNSGGDVQLKDDQGDAQDVLLYAAGTLPATGWYGPGVQPYSIGRETGQIISRIPDEHTGLPIADTDTAADWIQYSGNYTFGRRVLYPGWDMDVFFWPFSSTLPATITLGIAPDAAYDVVRNAIQSAQTSIEIEAYELTHYDLVDQLVQKAGGGVKVVVLLEGEPVGGMADQELWACKQIQAAGGQCWFMHNYHPTGYYIFDRYDLIHSKLVIIDRQRLVISTQNPSGGGLPSDDKTDGTYGSRGYVLYIESPELAARAGQLFDYDGDPTQTDITRWSSANPYGFGNPPSGYIPITTSGGVTSPVYFPIPQVLTDATHFELFTSPEASLRQSDALLGLLARAGAGDEVYVEQMYEHPDWGDEDTAPNLRLKAYLDAARRGARVRILLNSGTFGLDYIDLAQNLTTTTYLNDLARSEGIDLQARMGDPTEYGIHSKLVLVKLNSDGLAYSHVGSINGSETSNKTNREIAVQVESADLYEALWRVFWLDWNLSAPIYLPLVMKNYAPPAPPVDYVVISEVYYAASDKTQEWAEIYNPTSQTVDLSNYKIGDAVTADDFESMYQFPAGTVIQAGGVMVIAYDGSQVPEADFEMFNNSAVPDMIKTGWGTGDWELRNAGDQVVLLGPDNAAVDAVVYGDATFPGVMPHPGVSIFTHSLERRPAMYDTDDCSLDFRALPAPSPGQVDNSPVPVLSIKSPKYKHLQWR